MQKLGYDDDWVNKTWEYVRKKFDIEKFPSSVNRVINFDKNANGQNLEHEETLKHYFRVKNEEKCFDNSTIHCLNLLSSGTLY